MHDILSLLALVSIGIAWLVPNHYPPWTSFYNESCMALGLGLLLAGASLRCRALERPAVAWVLAAVACIPWLQWLFGQLWFVGDAWVGSLYLIGFALAVVTGATWARLDAAQFAARISVAVVVASTVSSVIGVWQVLDLPSLGIWAGDGAAGMRAVANLAQPNNLSTLIAFGALALLLLYEQRKFGALAAGSVLAVLLFGIALTQSRSALLFGPVIAAGLMWARTRGVETRTRPLVVLAASAIHWGVAWGWPAVQKALLQSSSLTLGERGTGSIRFKVWPVLADALSTAPWSGFGWLQVGAAEALAAGRHPPVGELWLHAHNMFFELAIWCGLPLGIALSGLIVYWYLSRARTIATVESLVGVLTVTILGMHSMLELPNHYAYFLIPAGLWIGLVEWQRGARSLGSPRWALAWAGVGACLTVGIWASYFEIEEDFRKVRFEGRKIGFPIRVEEVASSVPLSSLTGFLRFARTPPRPGMSREEIDAMDAAALRYPYIASLARVATVFALNGRLADATQRFLAIRHIHGDPSYQQAKRDLQESELGDHPAVRELQRALPP